MSMACGSNRGWVGVTSGSTCPWLTISWQECDFSLLMFSLIQWSGIRKISLNCLSFRDKNLVSHIFPMSSCFDYQYRCAFFGGRNPCSLPAVWCIFGCLASDCFPHIQSISCYIYCDLSVSPTQTQVLETNSSLRQCWGVRLAESVCTMRRKSSWRSLFPSNRQTSLCGNLAHVYLPACLSVSYKT